MTVTVDCDTRQSVDRISSRMRRDYSESLRELNLYVGQDNLLSFVVRRWGKANAAMCRASRTERS